ncbi:hypothetical protein BH10ACI2_BH10ACI2_13370 [soil metagenome]
MRDTIAHYKIISTIGAGGMGEVFLAQDTKLDRQVALKVLLDEVAGDEDRVRRFVQEAKAASALNHPNILTVYEIGEVEQTRYIATELIKGETLRDRLRGEPMTLREILDVAMQVAAALNAAHSAGIVHRDIKPENIMLRDDGIVKVLDFGLAKLTAATTGSVESEDATRAQVNTRPGVVMGTVLYMSPEQARGKETDARSDVWSLGVVIYEMLTKQTPFAGETANDSIAAILTKEPAPLDDVTPSELRRIVRKSLQKPTDERYQTVKDLLLDVKNLKRELEFSEELERSQVPHSTGSSNVGTAQMSEQATAAFGVPPSGRILIDTQERPPKGENPNVTTSSSLEYAVTQAKSHKLAVGIIALVLLGVISAVAYFGFIARSGAKQINSIAVMPFENRNSDADTDYLSDGLAESLIFRLTQIPDLRVSPTSSVMRYKGKETDIAKIASELGVDAVMTGRLTKRGDNLNITVELVDVRTNKSLWGEQYERKLSDLLTTQREIVAEIVGKLQLKLSGESEQKLAKKYTDNNEAYQLYLQGRYHWNKRQTDEFEKAIVFFKQAIEKDPNYALAYSGLADTYSLFPAYGNFRPKDYMPQAKQAALKALELDANLAEAHASLGEAIFYYDYDWVGAEKAFKRAIEINPKYATAHQWYAELLQGAGRFDESIKEMSKAVELDPFSMIINQQMGAILLAAKRFDESLMQNKKVNELFPDEIGFHYTNATIYEAQGKYSQAFEEYILAAKARKAKPEEIQAMKDAYKKGGWDGFVKLQQDPMLKFLNDPPAADKNGYVPAILFASSYSYLKDKEKTIEYLNKAHDERSMSVLYLKVSFNWDFVRDDPRFKELVKRVGIPE